MTKMNKKADIYLINKEHPGRTMIPCPSCMTFHSANEYFKVKKTWHVEILKEFMNVLENEFDTQCPTCGRVFRLCVHRKKLRSNEYKVAYFTIPRKTF